MKFWKDGFFETQSEENDRAKISEQEYESLLVGQMNGQRIITNEDGAPKLVDYIKNEEDIVKELRLRREKECFAIVNRGSLYFEQFTPEQMSQIRDWYNSWLEVTKTKAIPEKPNFII